MTKVKPADLGKVFVDEDDAVQAAADLDAAYEAEEAAENELAAQRKASVKLRADLDKSQTKVDKLNLPFWSTRDTRRMLEREYGYGEWASSGIPATVIADQREGA